MTKWTDEYDSVFFISIATIFTGFCGIMLKYCFRSKCSKFSCCGLTIERNVEAELEEQRIELAEHNTQPTQSSSTKNKNENIIV